VLTLIVHLVNTDSSDQGKVIINELLFFVFNKYDNHSSAAIQAVVSNFYREDEIMTAKQVLVQRVHSSLSSIIQPHARKRIGDSKIDRAVEDILNIVDVIDENDARDLLPIFSASQMLRIPTMPDDMTDMAVIRNELSDLRPQFNSLLNTVTSSLAALPPSVPASIQPVDVATASAAMVSDQQSVFQQQSVSEADDVQSNFASIMKANCDGYENEQNFIKVIGKKKNKKKTVVGDSA